MQLDRFGLREINGIQVRHVLFNFIIWGHMLVLRAGLACYFRFEFFLILIHCRFSCRFTLSFAGRLLLFLFRMLFRLYNYFFFCDGGGSKKKKESILLAKVVLINSLISSGDSAAIFSISFSLTTSNFLN